MPAQGVMRYVWTRLACSLIDKEHTQTAKFASPGREVRLWWDPSFLVAPYSWAVLHPSVAMAPLCWGCIQSAPLKEFFQRS